MRFTSPKQRQAVMANLRSGVKGFRRQYKKSRALRVATTAAVGAGLFLAGGRLRKYSIGLAKQAKELARSPDAAMIRAVKVPRFGRTIHMESKLMSALRMRKRARALGWTAIGARLAGGTGAATLGLSQTLKDTRLDRRSPNYWTKAALPVHKRFGWHVAESVVGLGVAGASLPLFGAAFFPSKGRMGPVLRKARRLWR